jgi:hypothetical protein
MSQTYEICIACGNHTGKAGAAEDSIYVGDNCGLGPLCEECYHDIKSSFAGQLEEEQAFPWLPAPDGPGWWWDVDAMWIFRVLKGDKELFIEHATGVKRVSTMGLGHWQRVQPPRGDAK